MEFIVYSKHNCPYCIKIKKILELKNYTYQELIYEEDFDKDQFYDRFGEGSTFPQVIFNNQKLGGCVDSIKYLKDNNLL